MNRYFSLNFLPFGTRIVYGFILKKKKKTLKKNSVKIILVKYTINYFASATLINYSRLYNEMNHA